MIVAIDGPAAAGKGTLARRIARHFNLAYLDTGAIYRATGFQALEAGDNPADPALAEAAAKRVRADQLSNPKLREEAVAKAASIVAAIPGVRAALLAFQRDFASHPPAGSKGAVLDGRDIGTVVCPEAEVKLFVTASAEARALRRFKELQEQDPGVIYLRVLQDMKDRDARDSQRQAAPLVPAPDAVVLDTTALDADAVFKMACDIVGRKVAP